MNFKLKQFTNTDKYVCKYIFTFPNKLNNVFYNKLNLLNDRQKSCKKFLFANQGWKFARCAFSTSCIKYVENSFKWTDRLSLICAFCLTNTINKKTHKKTVRHRLIDEASKKSSQFQGIDKYNLIFLLYQR